MARKGEDPMSGLLSNLGGIDSTLFQKPQAMKDMRSGQTSPVRPSNLPGESSQAAASQQHRREGNNLRSSQHQLADRSVPSTTKMQPTGSVSARKPGDSNSQLSALLGGSLTSKSSRPMRDMEKSPPQRAEPSGRSQSQNTPPVSQSAGVANSSQSSYRDLDSIFGGQSSSQALGNDRGNPASDDPFALFGGMGTTEQPRQAQPTDSDDFLRDFASPREAGQVRSDPSAASPPRLNTRHSQQSQASAEDWGGMLAASDTMSSPQGSVTSHHRGLSDSSTGAFQNPSHGEPPRQGSAAEAPPPSYESVMNRDAISPRSSVASPRSGKVSSPRAGAGKVSSPRIARDGSGSYQMFHDDELEHDRSRQKPRQRPIPPHIQEHERQGSGGKEGELKDQARQWLSAGKTWLSGASKKVAQAVKETQTQINHKLEELEGRNTHGGVGPAQGQSTQRRARPDKLPGQSNADDVASIPKYYYEWAETIAALPQHEQGNTLAAMPEDDAQIINRVLRSQARRQSRDVTEDAMLAEAKRRSMSATASQASRRRDSFSEDNRPRSISPPAQTTFTHDDSSNLRPKSASAKVTKAQQSAEADLLGFEKGASAKSKPASPELDRPQQTATPARGSPSRVGGQAAQPVKSNPATDQGSVTGSQISQKQRKESAKRVEDDGSADLMGFSAQQPGAPASRDRQAEEEHDFLGMSGPASAAKPQHATEDASSFFGPPASSVPNQNLSPDIQDLFGQSSSYRPAKAGGGGAAAGVDSMIGFDDDDDLVGMAGHEGLYQPGLADEEQADEPEARKVARRKRLAAMHSRMQQQLAEKQARDKAESQQREAQHDLRALHRERIEAWKSGKKDNIRALLSTLHTVLWEGSGWTAPGMTDLVEVNKVKRSYMKANLVVHPDKVKQKGGSVEQIVIADMAFDTLKNAWNKFEQSELRK